MGAIRESGLKQRTPAECDDTQRLHVDVMAPDGLPTLPAAVEVAAYRIVQEALANVIHHAHAHRCSVRLSCEEQFLRVEITDDGMGLPAGHRIGVGGTCEASSVPGGGVQVQACLPLSKD